MKHSVLHDLDAETAKRVTERAFAVYRERFPRYRPTLRWDDASTALVEFSARGVSMVGKIELRPREITIGLEVPLILRPFRRVAIEIIEREIKLWVEKAKAGAV